MNEHEIHQILSRALSADEAGNKEVAIAHYLEAVDAILKIGDRDLRTKLNRFATQSLDRAEQLKGVVRRPEPERLHSPSQVVPVKSNLYIIGIGNYLKALNFQTHLGSSRRNRNWVCRAASRTRKARNVCWNTRRALIPTYSFHS